MSESLSPEQVANMLHALGVQRHAVKRKDWGYRNGFVAGDCDAESWRDLVAKGLAVESRPSLFHVNAAGLEALGRYGHEVTKKMRDACQPAPAHQREVPK